MASSLCFAAMCAGWAVSSNTEVGLLVGLVVFMVAVIVLCLVIVLGK